MMVLPREALVDLLACWIALLLVAAIGWIDDHRGLAARWRLFAHALAALIVLGTTMLDFAARAGDASARMPDRLTRLPSSGCSPSSCSGRSICTISWMASMACSACQAIFVFLVLAALMVGWRRRHAGTWCALAAAVAGFLPFNFPRARMFMGDVGSGAIGLSLEYRAAPTRFRARFFLLD